MTPPWMPLYVADYLADTGHLSTVEHGAYLLLIMHYWQSGGLPDDDKKLARITRLSPREWAGVKDTVAEFFDAGWRHNRIDEEMARAEDKISKRSAAGKAGAAVRHGKRKANASQPQPPSQEKKEEANASSKEKPSRRGERLPEGWSPTAEQIFSLRDEGFTDDDHRREIPIFRDYWVAKPGAGGCKLDWFATYRNWLRKSRELRSRNQAPAAGPQGGQRQSGGGLVGAGLRRAAALYAVADGERAGPRRGFSSGGDDYSQAANGAGLVEGESHYGGFDGEGLGGSGDRLPDGTGGKNSAAQNRR